MATRNEKRQKILEVRLRRLKAMGKNRVEDATQNLKRAGGPKPLQVRTEFVYRPRDPSAPVYSDRRLPPPKERPPATGLLSPRGSALRLELILLGVAQHQRAGAEFKNEFPLMPGYKQDHSLAWVNLITTAGQVAGSGNFKATPLSKKSRSLNAALDVLEDAGFVFYPSSAQVRGRREGFLLMDERGSALADLPTYRVPRSGESTVALPPGFLHNGWVHVLEDSEIALLLMVACGKGALPDPAGWIAIPAEDRLSNYGLGRDAFSAAHPILREMGLLEVQRVGRHSDGRAVDFEVEGPSLHRLRLVRHGFEENSYDVACEALETLKTL